MLASVGSTPYNVMLVLHLLSAIVGVAPLLAQPLVQSQLSTSATRRAASAALVKNGRRIAGPALILSGLSGFALAGMSSKVFKMSQTWLVAAALVWIAMNAVLHAKLLPAEKAAANGDESAATRATQATALLVVAFVVMLVLMVFKPGQSA